MDERRGGLINTGEPANDPRRTLWVEESPTIPGLKIDLPPNWKPRQTYETTGQVANDPRRVLIREVQTGICLDITPEVAEKLTSR